MRAPALTLAALVLAQAPAAQSPAAPATSVLHADIVFATVPTNAGAVPLRLDLYLPPATTPSPAPVVVWIHGGSWRSGSRNDPAPVATYLTGQGFAVASIDYRLSHEAQWPAQLHDCKGAVRWLRAYARAYGLDPARIGVWGVSAGGHLAAMLGVTGGLRTARLGDVTVELEGAVGGNPAQSSRVQAVVNWYGSTGFLSMSSFPGVVDHDAPDSPESALIGAPIRTRPALVATAEPATFLSRDDPPMLTQHGTFDTLVPYHQGLRLVEQGVRRCGLDWRLVPVVGGGHGGAGFLPVDVSQFLAAQLGAPRPVVAVRTAGPPLVEGGAAASAVRIARSGSTAAELVVRVDVGGTADEGRDFAPIGGVVRLAPGQAAIDVPLRARDDALVEGDEVVRVTLCSAPGYRVDPAAAAAEVAIVDDEVAVGLPSLMVAAVDPDCSENGDGARVDVLRGGATTAPLDVALRLHGTATNGVDYVEVPAVVRIPAGVTAVSVPLQPLADGRCESTETILVDVEPGPGYRVGPLAGATVRLFDAAAGGGPLVGVTAAARRCDEAGVAPGEFVLTRTSAAGPLTVQLAWRGTASNGADYAAMPATTTFAAGELIAHLLVQPRDDLAAEGDETVRLEVLPGAGYRPGFRTAQDVVIVDDDVTVPGASDFVLDVAPLAVARPGAVGLLERAPQQLWALFTGATPGFEQLPGVSHPVLLGGAELVEGPVAVGVFDAGGRAAIVLEVPRQPALVDLDLLLQAASIGATAQVRLSGRVVRRVGQ